MKIEELKQNLQTPIKEDETWLQNQWPAQPNKRYSDVTYLNYQNIEDLFGKKANTKIRKAVLDHPEVPVVVVAVLDKNGKVEGPRAFVQNEAEYYGHYELFACAAGMDGFVEVFHNVKKKN
jgi:hypothetical protein